MRNNLWFKFFLLLTTIAGIALSAAFVLRGLMNADFRDYLEGERENQVYRLTADLERAYERHGAWDRGEVADGAVRALMSGMAITIKDQAGNSIMNTETALTLISPRMRDRVHAVCAFCSIMASVPATPYPLFLSGEAIGLLEVRFLKPVDESLFVERSTTFLLASLAAMGGLALALSLIFSRKLTRPLRNLARAASAISAGDLQSRVPVAGNDELGSLSIAFNRMIEALEFQEALRRRLMTNVAHELRTPLSAMRAELEGMIDELIPFGRAELKSLHEETGRLGRIVEGMEELARAEASSLSLRKEPLVVLPFLAALAERFHRRFAEKGVNLLARQPSAADPELVVFADPDRLGQVLVNLLQNALKATPAGGTVRIEAVRRQHEVQIIVEDTGPGIDPDDLPHIFERFYRTSKGGGDGVGLGIGLAIARELIIAHGGKIEAASEVGKGATFTVRLFDDPHNSS